MNRLQLAKRLAAMSVVLPAAASFIWEELLWLHALALLWLAGAAICWIGIERKHHSGQMRRTIHTLQAASNRTLNHHRHDWMNDLQVLYGYIRMQKPDKMVECVEKIKDRMAEESRIAKLGEPALIHYIQSFRTLTNAVQLRVEIAEGVHLTELPVDSSGISESLIEIMNAYRFAAAPALGEPAVLTMKLSMDDHALYAAFYYQGELTSEQRFASKINQQLEGAPLRPVEAGQPYGNMLLRAEWRA
ncbi:Spo0B domain-containing protein [Paenibacillus protaetiae]|uniref:Histidine kinase n=1 Tax=Paenibacillus protaetiae TaxID=2509456 RepID=A0A4V0YER9_9BACL|nr:Spo0B domain-containing protein [Paenibacillus protaetiae]QAY65171.1 histidine kinase [Paenibacillus protaetiae]